MVTTMTEITSVEVLRNGQHPLTRRLQRFITDRPTFGISLRPPATELRQKLNGKEASP